MDNKIEDNQEGKQTKVSQWVVDGNYIMSNPDTLKKAVAGLMILFIIAGMVVTFLRLVLR